MADVDESAQLAGTPLSGYLEQGRLLEPASAPEAGVADPGAAGPGLEFVRVDVESCGRRLHRCRRGDIVTVPHGGGRRVAGIVLSEGFDVHCRHVGWVGVPGESAVFRALCTLLPGDEAEFQRATLNDERLGAVVEVRVWR
jgi:hypothetical protein